MYKHVKRTIQNWLTLIAILSKKGAFQLNDKVINYLLNKIAALGFLVFIMSSYVLIATSFDLYEFVETITNIAFWLYMSGYALLTTMLIDLVSYKWKELTNKSIILLHCLAGFVAFFPQIGLNPISIIAGLVGALCAFIYALGTFLFKKKKNFVWAALLVFPLLLGMSFVDFTEKKNWNAQMTESTYSAEFEYFNGKHEIPLTLEKGDKVTIYVSITLENGGGHGFHVRDENNDYVAMRILEETNDPYEQVNTNGFQFDAKEAGVYQLTVTGDDLDGKIEVKWEIDE